MVLNDNEIKIQAQRIVPIIIESYRNMPKEFRKKSDGLSKRFMQTEIVNTYDINTKKKLAFIIRKFYGFGTFNVLFYNLLQRSSKYNPNFICYVQRKKPCKNLHQCTVYKRHKKGWVCKENRRFRPNWSKRAKITIEPAYNMFGGDDFAFKWHKRDDLMFYFSKWFWKDKR